RRFIFLAVVALLLIIRAMTPARRTLLDRGPDRERIRIVAIVLVRLAQERLDAIRHVGTGRHLAKTRNIRDLGRSSRGKRTYREGECASIICAAAALQDGKPPLIIVINDHHVSGGGVAVIYDRQGIAHFAPFADEPWRLRLSADP